MKFGRGRPGHGRAMGRIAQGKGKMGMSDRGMGRRRKRPADGTVKWGRLTLAAVLFGAEALVAAPVRGQAGAPATPATYGPPNELAPELAPELASELAPSGETVDPASGGGEAPATGMPATGSSGGAAMPDDAGEGGEAAMTDLLPDAPADGGWTLSRLIDRAVRENPRVRAQQAGIDVARAGEAAARWEYFPNPQVQVEGNPGDHQVNTTVTQPLYAFGRLGAGLASARAQGRIAGKRADEAQRDIALRVLELYGQFASAQRGIAVLDDDIRRHLALEAMIQRRVAAGVSAPVDLNLVQTRLSQSRISRINLRARLHSTLAALSEVVGVALPAERIAVPAASPDAGPAAAPEVLSAADGRGFIVDEAGRGELLQRCLERNPSLQRAEAEIAAAEAEARRARAVVFPTIAARFENRARTSLYPGTGLPDTRLTIGFTLATGSGLASLANVRAADGRIRAAQQARDALRQDVTTSLIGALETFASARKAVTGLRLNRTVQEQTAASYNRMFLAGKRSWLDLLNMVREQSSIERDLADAEIQLMVADYRLRIEAGDAA